MNASVTGAGGLAQASPDGPGGLGWLERPDRPGRHRVGTEGRLQPSGLATVPVPPPDGADPELFTRSVARYAAERPGEPIAVLQAGCSTAGGTLDVGRLRAEGCELVISPVDSDDDVVRAAVGEQLSESACTLGDLRTVPLPPRSFDVVHCSMLLDRIRHAELILDRFVDALKPGGLLLLQIGDRDCAAGFLDRKLPVSLRAAAWRGAHPGQPGPYPAIYEPLVSARGVQSFVLRHGLVIAQRQELNTLAGERRRPGPLLARKLVALVSRSRLSWSHDELRYVIRKPEDRFARVL
jgi:SAM-dependent methyltransferase